MQQRRVLSRRQPDHAGIRVGPRRPKLVRRAARPPTLPAWKPHRSRTFALLGRRDARTAVNGKPHTAAGPPDGLQLTLRTAADAVVLACHGAIDFSTRRSLAASIDRALHDPAGRRLDLDLAGVRFIDSTGLQALMRALVKCEDASAAWTLRPSRQVEKLLVL